MTKKLPRIAALLIAVQLLMCGCSKTIESEVSETSGTPGSVSIQSVMGSADAVVEAYAPLTDVFTIYVFDRKSDITGS